MPTASVRSRSRASAVSAAELPAKPSVLSDSVVSTCPLGPTTDVTPGTGTSGMAAVAVGRSAGSRVWSTVQDAAPAA